MILPPENVYSRFRQTTTILLLVALQMLVFGTRTHSEPADATGGPDVAEATFPQTPDLVDYLQWAQVHNPTIGLARHRFEAQQAVAGGAGALPGLRLAWGEMIVPVETRVGPQQRIFSVSQSLPWFGVLGAKKRTAEAQADIQQAQISQSILQVAKAMGDTWYELAFLQEQSRLLSEFLDLARQTESFTRTAYAAGEMPYGHVLKAQMEVGRLEIRLAGLKDRERPLTVRLNTTAGLTADHPVPQANLPVASPVFPVETEMQEILDHNNPQLLAVRHQQNTGRHQVDLAKQSGGPDLTLGVDYIMTGPARMPGTEDDGKDPIIARLAVSLPLWGGQTSARKGAAAGNLRAAGAQLAAVRLRLTAELEEALFARRDADRRLRLHDETLIPHGRQYQSVMHAAYRSAQATFSDLLTADQTVLELEIARRRALADRAIADNALATLLGVSVLELDEITWPQLRPDAVTEEAQKHE